MHTCQATLSCGAASSGACDAYACSSWSCASAARCPHALHRSASAPHPGRHPMRVALLQANAARLGCAAAATDRACSVQCAGVCSQQCRRFCPPLQRCQQMPSSAVCCAARACLHRIAIFCAVQRTAARIIGVCRCHMHQEVPLLGPTSAELFGRRAMVANCSKHCSDGSDDISLLMHSVGPFLKCPMPSSTALSKRGMRFCGSV